MRIKITLCSALALLPSSVRADSLEATNRIVLVGGLFESKYVLEAASSPSPSPSSSIPQAASGDPMPLPGDGETEPGSTPTPTPMPSSTPIPSPTPVDPELQARADEAAALLSSGTAWGDISEYLRASYSNVYPQDAVLIAGASALNLMLPEVLTPQLVSGYVKHAGSWQTPYMHGGTINPSTLLNLSGAWPGWGKSFPVVKVTDPLAQAEVIGHVSINAVLSNGRLGGYYYTGALNDGVEGVMLTTSPSGFGTGYSELIFAGDNIKVIQPW